MRPSRVDRAPSIRYPYQADPICVEYWPRSYLPPRRYDRKGSAFPQSTRTPRSFPALCGSATKPLPCRAWRLVDSPALTFRLSHRAKDRIYWTKVSINTFASDNTLAPGPLDRADIGLKFAIAVGGSPPSLVNLLKRESGLCSGEDVATDTLGSTDTFVQ